MHQSSILRMEWFIRQYLTNRPDDRIRVLDVGSFDPEFSYRSLFDAGKFDYVGLDMSAGPNVDIVLENPYDWSGIESESYDVVISGQAFEHIEFFWITMAEMVRVLQKGGLLCIVAPQGFGEHRCPVDCYRFFADGMIALARYTKIEPLHASTNCAPPSGGIEWYSKNCSDSMLVARKPEDHDGGLVDLKTYRCTPVDPSDLKTGLAPLKPGVRVVMQKVIREIKRPFVKWLKRG